MGSTPRIVLPIARCLQRHGIDVHVASLLPDNPPLRSRTLASFHLAPDETKAFVAFVTSLVRAHNIKLVYPCGDEALTLLAHTHAQLQEVVKLASPPPPAARAVLNKDITLAKAAELGIPAPAEHTFADEAAFRDALPSIRFPLIAKPKSKEEGGKPRIRYLNTPADLERELASDPRFFSSYLVQEYIPGVGVGIEILIHDGQPVAAFQHRRLSELPIGGGVSVRARAEAVSGELRRHALRLLRGLDWNGVAMVEFRHDPLTDRFALMEINGRYWGSVSLSLTCGIEFPWYEWQLAHGEHPTPPHRYKLKTMRWLAGDLERLPQVLGEVSRKKLPLSAFLRDCAHFLLGFVDGSNDAVWRLNDPRPALDDLRATLDRAFIPALIKAIGKVFPRFSKRWAGRKLLGSPQASTLYEKLRTGLKSVRTRTLDGKPRNILVLCHGNIMRSPFVERVLRKSLPPDVVVRSAGLGASHGRPADRRAIEIARTYGIDLTDHRASPVTEPDVEQADAIIVMDYRNAAMAMSRFPGSENKIFMLADWRPENQSSREIIDPYAQTHEVCVSAYEDLYRTSTNLVVELTTPKSGRPKD
ncbi:MAG: ATP-grasp domain-containing protein [Rhodospirillaceae bacterium]